MEPLESGMGVHTYPPVWLKLRIFKFKRILVQRLYYPCFLWWWDQMEVCVVVMFVLWWLVRFSVGGLLLHACTIASKVCISQLVSLYYDKDISFSFYHPFKSIYFLSTFLLNNYLILHFLNFFFSLQFLSRFPCHFLPYPKYYVLSITINYKMLS